MAGELGIGDDINAVQPADRRQIIEHVFDHRLACNQQQRLGLRKGEGVQTGGVTGSEDNHLHWLYFSLSGESSNKPGAT